VIDKDEINQRFGRRLAQCRKRAGLSQEALGDAISLTRTSITNIEHGRQPIQLHTLFAIAEALSVEPNDLLPGLSDITSRSPVQREHLKTISAKTATWIAKVSAAIPVKQTEAKDGTES